MMLNINLNFLKKSKKGQAFESFRLLIAFILALAVLIIIYSMVRSVNRKATFISHQKFKEGIISATKSVGASTKEPFLIKDLQLEGIIAASTLASYTDINSECFYLVHGPGFNEEQSDSQKVFIEGRYQKIDVQVLCDFKGNNSGAEIDGTSIDFSNIVHTLDSPSCPTYCVVAFNKKINLNN